MKIKAKIVLDILLVFLVLNVKAQTDVDANVIPEVQSPVQQGLQLCQVHLVH